MPIQPTINSTAIRICHVSILHHRLDSRIMARQCKSLHEAGFFVNYVVADGEGDGIVQQIQVFDIGLRKGFFCRLLFQHLALLVMALKTRSGIIHLHDPELIAVGILFKLFNKKVIMDFHEDTPFQILDDKHKSIISRILKYNTWRLLERALVPRYNHIVTASDIVSSRLRKINSKCTTVHNYPDLDEFEHVPDQEKIYDIIYSGSISPRRGIVETLAAIENTGIRFAIMGDIQGGENFEQRLITTKAWKDNVIYLPPTGNRFEIIKAMKQAKIGMCNLLATENHKRSLPTKLFEYLASGIPIISTEIAYWKQVVDTTACGIYVNPIDLAETKKVILQIIHDDKKRGTLAYNARRIIQKYSWKDEVYKLFDIYSTI